MNVVSQYDECELDFVRQHEVDPSLVDLPDKEDVQLAPSQMKKGKATGSFSILPEILKVGQESHEFICMFLTLVRTVWRDKCVPQDWRDAILMSVPKQGIFIAVITGEVLLYLMLLVSWWEEQYRAVCSNLLNVCYESHSVVFRGGEVALIINKIFVVSQLAEKAIEHNSKQYLVFVDLHKAYDSVPCLALWIALQKLGLPVPDDLITLIKSFHQGMKARLRVDGDMLEETEVANGLRQGCTMAPTFFNLYACVVAER